MRLVGIISSMEAIDSRELLGDTFRYRDARAVGLSDGRVYRLRDAGEILAVGGGVYRWADAPPADLDLVEIAERVARATLCLETALARHGLIDSIPAAIDIAIPRGNTRPVLRAPSRLHQLTVKRSISGGKRSTSARASRSASIRPSARSSTSSELVIGKAPTSRGRRCDDGWANRGEVQRS